VRESERERGKEIAREREGVNSARAKQSSPSLLRFIMEMLSPTSKQKQQQQQQKHHNTIKTETMRTTTRAVAKWG